MKTYMTTKLEIINGKPFLKMNHYENGEMWFEDVARVYDINGTPYIRRMSEKIYLTPAALRGETKVYNAQPL